MQICDWCQLDVEVSNVGVTSCRHYICDRCFYMIKLNCQFCNKRCMNAVPSPNRMASDSKEYTDKLYKNCMFCQDVEDLTTFKCGHFVCVLCAVRHQKMKDIDVCIVCREMSL